MDEQGDHTGENIVYMYPDLETVMVGRFVKGVMEEARLGEVRRVREEVGALVVDTVVTEKGQVYRHEAPTKDSFGGGDPHLRDPYEDLLVTVRTSAMEEGGQVKNCFCGCSLPSNIYYDITFI